MPLFETSLNSTVMTFRETNQTHPFERTVGVRQPTIINTNDLLQLIGGVPRPFLWWVGDEMYLAATFKIENSLK